MKNGIPFEQADVTEKFETKSDVMKWIVQNQRARQTGRQLSKTELVAMADAIKVQTDKEAKEAQSNAGGDRRSEEHKKTLTANLPQAKRNPTSAEKAAAAIGVSRHTYEDMKLVAEEGSKEQIEIATVTTAKVPQTLVNTGFLASHLRLRIKVADSYWNIHIRRRTIWTTFQN